MGFKVLNKFLKQFVKILFILLIFSILLPQLIDEFVKILMMNELPHHKPRGNSTFVTSPYIEEKNSLSENLYEIINSLMN